MATIEGKQPPFDMSKLVNRFAERQNGAFRQPLSRLDDGHPVTAEEVDRVAEALHMADPDKARLHDVIAHGQERKPVVDTKAHAHFSNISKPGLDGDEKIQ